MICSKKIEKLIEQNFLNLNQWERQLEIDFKIHFMHFMPKSETNHYWEMSLIWDDLSLRISFRYSKKSAVFEICNTMCILQVKRGPFIIDVIYKGALLGKKPQNFYPIIMKLGQNELLKSCSFWPQRVHQVKNK